MSAETDAIRVDTDPGASELAELLKAVALKDRAAFEAFYDATVERALGLVARIAQQTELAEEIVNDVYMQVWRQADRFDGTRGNAQAWLSVICRSRALDSIRKNSLSPTTAATAICESDDLEFEDHPQDLLSATEEHSAVHAALQQLLPDERQLLALAYFRGYSHRELAEITGLPLGTVKTKTRRSLAKLKEMVVDCESHHEGSL